MSLRAGVGALLKNIRKVLSSTEVRDNFVSDRLS